MRLALDEARRAGPVSPNPAVGCVIVVDDAVVGRGHTQPPGEAHAEVMALRDAEGRTAGSTAYVTLEPCSHWGRTPPCAAALIAAGVARVVCAIPDPDKQVRGRGFATLRAAGVKVVVGDGADRTRRQLAAFLCHRLTGRPLVTAKFAASLDGRIATRRGDSRWISSEESRRWTLAQRRCFDAILIGSGTALADDPQLTAREPDGRLSSKQPLRVVLDARGRLPLTARVLSPEAATLVATSARSEPVWRRAIEERGADVELLPEAETGVVLESLLDRLGQQDVLSLLVEGGAAVHGAFFDAGLVDRVQAILAPIVIGGVAAPGAVGGRGAALLAESVRLLNHTVTQRGGDIVITGDVRPPPHFTLDADERMHAVE